MLGDPRDVVVQLDHAITKLGDFDEPARQRAVDQRLVASPAVGIGVVVRVMTHEASHGPKIFDDLRIGGEHVLIGVVRHFGGEATALVHRVDGLDTERIRDQLVFLAVGRGDMDDTGAVFGADVVSRGNHECIRMRAEEWEERLVPATAKRASFYRPSLRGVGQLLGVRTETRFCEDVRPAIGGVVHQRVVDVGSDGARQVARQCPRRGRPRQKCFAGFVSGCIHKWKSDGDRRVLALFVRVVHPKFGVGQRGLTPPAVGHDLVTLVDQALVP